MHIHSSHAREIYPALWRIVQFFGIFLLLLVLPLPLEVFAGLASYLPLHTGLETLSIVASSLVFAVVWSTPRNETSRNILLLGCVFFWVTILDLSHTLSYTGMPDLFTDNNPEKAIQFWLSARILSALGLLSVTFISWKERGSHRLAWLFMAALGALTLAVHFVIFFRAEWIPKTFIEGAGLTPIKRYSEYVIAAIYLLAAWRFVLLLKEPRRFNVSGLLIAASLMAMGELLFTLYGSVTDIYNLTGHLYKVSGALFLYQSVFVETIKQPYQQLRESEHKLQATIQALPDPLLEIDMSGRYIAVHSGSGTSLPGKNLYDALSPTAALACQAALKTALNDGKAYVRTEMNTLQGMRWFELSIARKPSCEEDTEPHLLVVAQDITSRRAASERIRQLANYDQLTGLPNQRLLNERFQLVQEVNPEQPMSLLWLNLDNFKDINDAIGYNAGDLVLKAITERLRSIVRDQDMISRLSSDNFVLLMPTRDQDEAARTANDVLELLTQPLSISGSDELVLSASLGLAVYPSDGDNLESLLHRAETAMYRVKAEGRNGYRFFAPDMQNRSARFLQLSSALRKALGRDELRLVYQPQIALADGRLVGAEALLRWQHPKLGAISPGEFIPVAESTGLIIQLGDWVIRRALQQLREWQDAGLPVVKVAVNLSAVQFVQAGLVEIIAQQAADSQVAPGLLELELTEAVAMQHSAAQIMNQLAAQGFRLSIDDFGTGYSSLSSLKGFAVDKLKIDQSFVRDLEHDSDDQAIIRTIIQMAHSLGLSAIAEGVETAAQVEFLRQNGCNEVQGYYFSRPLEAADFAAFMDKQRHIV